MSEIAVSTIITSFNNRAYLKEAVLSLLHQTLPDGEIIVVDDGSTEGPWEEARKFGDRITYLYQSVNRGSAAARNIGVRVAKGRYIAFLDSDDIALPTRLAIQKETLDRRPEIGLVYGNIYLLNPNGTSWKLRGGVKRYRSGFVYDPLVFKNFVPFSTVMMRREHLFEMGLFDESLRYAEDWDFLIPLSKTARFQYVGQPLVKFRIRPESQTSNIPETVKAFKRIQSKIFPPSNVDQETQKMRDISEASFELHLFNLSMRYGYWKKAIRHFFRAVFLYPKIFILYRHEIAWRLTSFLSPKIRDAENKQKTTEKEPCAELAGDII